MVAETTPTEQPMGPEDYGPLALQLSRAGGGRWERFLYSGPAGSRRYFVYTPAGYSLDQRVPMVVMLHGCTQSPADAAVGGEWKPPAEPQGVVVVYPAQARRGKVPSRWDPV